MLQHAVGPELDSGLEVTAEVVEMRMDPGEPQEVFVTIQQV